MVGADDGVRDPLELRRFDDVDAFTARVGEFLAAREAEHNLILGIWSNLRSMPEAFDGPTSNHIYPEIGYEPVRDVEVHRFEDT